MAKIKMKSSGTVSEHFGNFIISKQASGLSAKTLRTYQQHFNAIGKHLDIDGAIDTLTRAVLDKMIVKMQKSGLSTNSIGSYSRTLGSFLSWCNSEGVTDITIKRYKEEETIKETYTDRELKILLRKPNVKKCNFSEYRNWVIINFLLNSGSRAATIRAIQIRDVDLDSCIVYYRHTKNRKAQVIPLCSAMTAILRDYKRVRGGKPTDYLFPNESGWTAYRNWLALFD
jgi:integrase/recombinase XerD